MSQHAMILISRWRVSWMRWLTPQEENPWNFECNILNTILETIEPWKCWLKSKGTLTMGLSSALKKKLESSEGGFQSANFSAYQLPPMSKAPDVEVHILESDGSIGGMGETGLPPVAPVVANAVFAATGTRIRHRPMTPATFLEARG